MNYVEIDTLRYAAMILAAIENAPPDYPGPRNPVCEHGYSPPCGEDAEYLVPDSARPGGGGQDVEMRPAWFCREHLEEMLGHPPAEQPIFRRIVGPEQQEE
jgi:hypothetical protein